MTEKAWKFRDSANLSTLRHRNFCDHGTENGIYTIGDAEDVLSDESGLRNHAQLILTSPPFPLNHKKAYGNHTGQDYVEWFASLAPLFSSLIRDDGSIVIEIGNSWVPKRPVQSTLHLEALLRFVNHPDCDLRLCQQFACYNPSRMPSPAQWVTVNRERVTDSFTHVWWMAKSDHPKADNRAVLRPYSKAMQALLRTGSFNRGTRPSGFNVRKNAFSKDNGGSIAQNFFELAAIDPAFQPRLPNAFRFANTTSNDYFSRTCRELGITPHPARMPIGLAKFFVEFLTEPGDLVVDPFAGSNTTGFVAEASGRNWLSVEKQSQYASQARIRLEDPLLKAEHPEKR